MKFQVNDIVRVVEDYYAEPHDIEIGTIGVIKKVDNSEYPYEIRNGDGDFINGVKESEIVKIGRIIKFKE